MKGVDNVKTKRLIFCAFFTALTVVGAFLRLPLGHVIVTMQFLFTALAGLLLGEKWGAASQLLYLLLGFAGLPVFGGGGGVGYLLQPTCGFVLALPVCAYAVGALTEQTVSRRRSVLACAAALVLLYAVGFVYLCAVFRLQLDSTLPLTKLAALYLLPYLPGDCAKIFLCVLLSERLGRQLSLRKE